MSTTQQPTPLTDAESSRMSIDCDDSCVEIYIKRDGKIVDGEIVLSDFARGLEEQLEAMREAVKAAYEALENADGSSYHIRGDACLTREAFEQRAAVLAKLRPLLP